MNNIIKFIDELDPKETYILVRKNALLINGNLIDIFSLLLATIDNIQEEWTKSKKDKLMFNICFKGFLNSLKDIVEENLKKED